MKKKNIIKYIIFTKNMKKYGHTKTLFLQNGKYYKWSYKFDHCIECGNCNYKHKCRGLCTSCWDKERDKNKHRKEIKKKASTNFHKTHFIPVTERKKKEKTFNLELYRKKWYSENREALLIIGKIKRRLKSGKPCMQMFINGKTRYLPFESLEKPNSTVNNMKAYDEWRLKYKQFLILKNYYSK